MSERQLIRPNPVETISRVAAVGALLIAITLDPRFGSLGFALVGVWVGSDFWRKQATGLITREGDPHLFWFAMCLVAGLTLLSVFIFLSDMGLFL